MVGDKARRACWKANLGGSLRLCVGDTARSVGRTSVIEDANSGLVTALALAGLFLFGAQAAVSVSLLPSRVHAGR